MVIKNLFSKVWLNGLLTLLVPPVFGRQKRGLYSVCKYAIRLRRKSDDEIRGIVEHELMEQREQSQVNLTLPSRDRRRRSQRGLCAWCSERSYYLAAFR